MRRSLLPVVFAVLALCAAVSVRALSSRGDTHLAPPATTSGFTEAGNLLCRPLARLIDGRADASQLLLVRTEAEELARVAVPVSLRERDNALVGALAGYVEALTRVVSGHGGAASLTAPRARVNRLFAGLGLVACRV